MGVNNPLGSNTIGGIANLQPTLDRKQLGAQDNNVGVYHPVIQAAGLEQSTGLADHPNGGVVASVSGTTGSGNIYLPKPLDPTKPWTAVVLIEINDAQSITELHFGNANNDFYTGLRFNKICTTDFSGTFGGGTLIALTGQSISAGSKFYIGMTSDGSSNVTAFIIPQNPQGFNFKVGATISDLVNASAKTMAINSQSNGHYVFGQTTGTEMAYRISRLSISTQSTQNRIIGVYCSQTLNGPMDGLFQPPRVLVNTIGNDESAWYIIPGKQNSQPLDTVMILHPNANDGYFGLSGSNGNPQEFAKIYNAGYMMFGITGVDNLSDITGATSSNWAAGAGMRYRYLQWLFVTANFSGIRYLNLLGQSMGAMNALNLVRQYNLPIKTIQTISGAVDMTDSYINRTFKTIVDNAYGLWYQSVNPLVGVYPDQVISVTATAAIGATSLTTAALTYAIPSGTTLTLRTGTGQTQVVTTAAAVANATSISVTALTTGITGGASYNMLFHWMPISYGYSGVDDSYYTFPWKNVFSNATTYVVNDIIVQPNRSITTLSAANSAKYYYNFDPCLNAQSYKLYPLFLWHGDADTVIPIAQAQNLVSKIQAIGGSVNLVTVAGGTHLSANCYDGTAIVSNLNNYNK